MKDLADYERKLFLAAEELYFKACETSEPEDWFQAGLIAKQHRNALTKLNEALNANNQ